VPRDAAGSSPAAELIAEILIIHPPSDVSHAVAQTGLIFKAVQSESRIPRANRID